MLLVAVAPALGRGLSAARYQIAATRIVQTRSVRLLLFEGDTQSFAAELCRLASKAGGAANVSILGELDQRMAHIDSPGQCDGRARSGRAR
jgi:hypothetical protein